MHSKQRDLPPSPPPPLLPTGSAGAVEFAVPSARHSGAHCWQHEPPPPGFWWAGHPGQAAVLVLLDSRGLATWGAERLVTAPPPQTWCWCVLPLPRQPVVPRRPGKVVPCCIWLSKKAEFAQRKLEFGFSGNDTESAPPPTGKIPAAAPSILWET